MTRKEQRAIAAFTSRAGLPSGAFVLLFFQSGTRSQLKVWIDRSFLHVIQELPTEINGMDVAVEPMPMARAYLNEQIVAGDSLINI